MIDNIPYRTDAEDFFLYEENYTYDEGYFVVSQPSYLLSDKEEQKNGPFVTLVYNYDSVYDYTNRCLEYVFSETEEDAKKKHKELLDKWNKIEYTT